MRLAPYVSLAGLVLLLGLPARGQEPLLSPPPGDFKAALPIPPLLLPRTDRRGVAHLELRAEQGLTALLPGKAATRTFGYNGAFLGPTIRLRRGQPVALDFLNGLDEPTSLHWHGLEVPAIADIIPPDHHGLAPGGRASARFTPDQPAATLWYHAHTHERTGPQVYAGLAGFLLLDDPAQSPDLPHSYGVDDLPLLIQDRRFKPDGSLAYLTLKKDKEGMLGNRILVNGALQPHVDVAAGLLRLRILNGSNARTYNFALSDGRVFWQVGTDAGLLSAPAPIQSLMLAPAERAEIVVDLRGDAGKRVALQSLYFFDAGDGDEAPSPDADAPDDGEFFQVLELRVGPPKGKARALPASLTPLPAADPGLATVHRSFLLEDKGDMTINGKLYDLNRVDERVKAGAWEIWHVENRSPESVHTFHVHGCIFRVLQRNRGLVPNDKGWKDTTRLLPGETMDLLLHFDRQLGRYMYHCHILEHEDMGMMGTYEVVP